MSVRQAGGPLRMGFEGNVRLDREMLGASNAARVARAVGIVKAACRAAATPRHARDPQAQGRKKSPEPSGETAATGGSGRLGS